MALLGSGAITSMDGSIHAAVATIASGPDPDVNARYGELENGTHARITRTDQSGRLLGASGCHPG
ncbi:hypothetical protein GCM10010112_87430 [Actinoplanes lobatus]|uniref:Uncharacterized protein n=1 Tax=Actinoplanes lobatus TaxID=113568 RepID=A0ABQ4AZE2_9ACTN|nr:hypothetical protein GCM10010112_87430 [Actinoplanes lobatus]GIE46378.1 hypothetical protein Alo02nite_92760 [Actinoplanes lobatus]